MRYGPVRLYTSFVYPFHAVESLHCAVRAASDMPSPCPSSLDGAANAWKSAEVVLFGGLAYHISGVVPGCRERNFRPAFRARSCNLGAMRWLQ